MREYPEYRFVLEQLNARFGGKGWITLEEIADYDGCCVRTARSRYSILDKSVKGIDVAVLAHRKCELAH